MKSIPCLAFLGVLMAFALRVSAGDPGPVHFHFSVVQQVSEGPVIFKTNVTAKATNNISTAKYVTSEYVLDNARLLKMLANSYNTNFPATADLKMFGLGGIAVVDGTNVILEPSIMSLNFSNVWTISGTQIDGHFSNQNGSVSHTTVDFIETFPTAFNYDDSGLATKDGTTTSLSAPGIESLKFHIYSVNGRYQKYNYDVKFTGAGIGTIFNGSSSNQLALTGEASAHINNHP